MSDQRSRGWCFTINNYSAFDDIDIETLANDAQYVIRGREVGEGGTPTTKDSSISKPKSFNQVKTYLSRAHLSDSEEPAPKQSSTVKRMAIGRNGEQGQVVLAGKQTNGNKFYSLQEKENSKPSKISFQQSFSATMQSYSVFVARNVQLFSTFLKMNGGMGKQEPENQENFGNDSQTTTKNL